MQRSPLVPFLGAGANSVAAGILKITVAALRIIKTIILLRIFLVSITTTAIETSWKLFEMERGVTEPMVVLALGEAGLDLVFRRL